MIKLNEKNNSEIIVNAIINKIISLTISKSLSIKVDKRINEKCFDFFKESINNVISSFYIFYDKDDDRMVKEKSFFKCDIDEIKNDVINNDINKSEIAPDKNKSILDNYFYNNSYTMENNWDLMEEPISSNLDRYSSTLIKFEERNVGIEGKYNLNNEKIIEEEENNSENNRNKHETNEVNKNFIKKKTKILNLQTLNINNKPPNNEEFRKNTKKSTILNQLKTIDLEPEKNYENKQIIKLRAIFERKEKEKEEEDQINKQEKEKIKFKQRLAEENLKKYIGKKITKDHNGEIIFIKSIKPDKLKKEFIFTNSKSKTILNNSPKPKEKENGKDIKIEKNEEIDKNEKPKKGAKSYNNRFKNINNIDSNKKNIEIPTIPMNKKIPIITSGSNFNLMNMEVGVSLKEDEKFKTGGLDFFNKYKKFSIQVYNKKLKETENSNNLVNNVEIMEEPNTKTIEEMNNLYKTNYTLGNSTFDGNNSIALNTDSNLFNKKTNNNIMFSTNSNNSSLFKNYMKQANMSTFRTKNNFNLTPVINMKSGASSLLNSIDRLNLVPKEEKKLIKKSKNLFRFKISKNIKQNIYDDMNNFTKNILLNKKDTQFNEKIMNTTGGIRGISNPGKPNMREIIQEIGLKGKVMRQRTKFLPAIKSNFLDNENFFKQ